MPTAIQADDRKRPRRTTASSLTARGAQLRLDLPGAQGPGALIAKTPGQDPGTALHLPVGFLAAPGQIQRLRMTDMEDLRLPRVRTKVGWAAAAANAR